MKANLVWMIQHREHDGPWRIWDGPWGTRAIARKHAADDRQHDVRNRVAYRRYRVVPYVPKPAPDACGKRVDATEGEA